MSRRSRTYDAALRKAEELRGELVEEHPGRASPEELERWADDPVGWTLEAGRDPVDYQREVMRSVAENKRTAWAGCHACGKEWTIGSLAVWGAYARGMLVLVVSATEPQVLGQTMPEVRRAWRAARRAHGIGGELYQGSVRIGGEDRIVARTGSANVDALTGWHDAENGVLVLISEGQGERLEEAAYDAAEGNVTTSKGRILAAGNPVRPEGRFFEIHQRETWKHVRTSAFDTPNVKAGEQVRDGFPAPDWPEDVAREFGEDSPWYSGRVLARFPETAESSLVERQWLDRAFERHEAGRFVGDRKASSAVVAVDVARFGRDRTVVCTRNGRHVHGFETWHGLDTQETAARVLRTVREVQDTEAGPVSRVVVDTVGVGGGVADALREELPELTWTEASRRGRRVRERSPTLVEFNAGERAPDADRFRNLRSQAYWHLRERLEEGDLALPPDDGLRRELQATRTEVTSAGKVAVESKDTIKSRLGGSSPDRADALSMTFASELEQSDATELYFASG